MNVIKPWALWGSSLRIGSNSPKSMITKAPKGFLPDAGVNVKLRITRLMMAMALKTSVGAEYSGAPDEILNVVLASAMAGRRAMAVISDQDDEASAVVQAVSSRMEAAGAVVMVVIANSGTTMQDLLDQVPAPAANRNGARSSESEALALRLLQGEDAGLLTVVKAHELEAGLLESLLSLSQIDFGDGRFVQVLLSGNGSLNAQLERPSEGRVARQVRVERWLLAPQPQVRIRPVSSGSGTAFRDRRPDGPVQASPLRAVPPSPGTSPAGSSRFFRRFVAFVLLVMGVTTAGWFAADHFWTGVKIGTVKAEETAEAPVDFPSTGQNQARSTDLLVSTTRESIPTVQSGEAVVVRLETVTNKFVYCYYIDGFGQVARIFPNRYQLDAFVPAGQPVQIPPGPKRPFNIRLDMAGQAEAIACLASSIEVDGSRIAGSQGGDLAPIPGLQMEGLLNAFDRLSGAGVSSLNMPITVVSGAKARPRSGAASSPLYMDQGRRL